jgi:hypothetical protein
MNKRSLKERGKMEEWIAWWESEHNGYELSLEKNSATSSNYKQVATIKQGGKVIAGIKAAIMKEKLHILPSDYALPVNDHNFNHYLSLLSFWIEYATIHKISHLFAQLAWWQSHFQEKAKTVFLEKKFTFFDQTSINLIDEQINLGKRTPGWVFGSFDPRIAKESRRLIQITQAIQTLSQEDEINDFNLRGDHKTIQYYYEGEKGVINFSLVDRFSNRNEQGVEEVIFVDEEENYAEKVIEFFSQIKSSRRLINLYNPPKMNFEQFLSKHANINYRSASVKEKIHQALMEKYQDWKMVERICLQRKSDKTSYFYSRENYCLLHLGELFFLYEDDVLFKQYSQNQYDNVISEMEDLVMLRVSEQMKQVKNIFTIQ